jgi:hypothetical protein
MADLTKKLAMTHLQKSDEELRLQAEERADASEKTREVPPEKKPDPRDQEVYTFPFQYTDLKGKVYKGTFTNHVLSIGDKMNVSALESSFNGGQPYDSIEDVQKIVNRGIAHMTFSLRKREAQSPPKWADNLRLLKDEDLVLALFAEVSAHEGTFHGRTSSQESGEDATGDAPAGA